MSEVDEDDVSEKNLYGDYELADRSHLSLAVLDDYVQGKAIDIDKLVSKFRTAMRENHINL